MEDTAGVQALPKYFPLPEEHSIHAMSGPVSVMPSPPSTSNGRERRIKQEDKDAYKEAKKISDAIDKQLKLERMEKEREKVAKLLVLGASESGKTTVLKQIKLLHGSGLEADRPSYIPIVYLNVINAMKDLCQGLIDRALSVRNPENQPHMDFIMEKCPTAELFFLNGNPKSEITAEESLTKMFAETSWRIKALWEDRAVKEVFQKGWATTLQDSAGYFLDNLDRFTNENFVPTNVDILQARVRTMGVTEHRFHIDSITYRIYDVGGLRSQRKFWAPYFDDCNAIIFLAAISSFDQTLAEDPSVNRMTDSLQLFKAICKHPLLRNTSIILFLNKIDVLRKKLEAGVKVSDYMPDYKDANSFEAVTSHFQKLFFTQKKLADKEDAEERERARQKEKAKEKERLAERDKVVEREKLGEKEKSLQKEIYVHLTHATDTKQMRVIVAAVNVIVQRNNLRNSGLL